MGRKPISQDLIEKIRDSKKRKLREIAEELKISPSTVRKYRLGEKEKPLTDPTESKKPIEYAKTREPEDTEPEILRVSTFDSSIPAEWIAPNTPKTSETEAITPNPPSNPPSNPPPISPLTDEAVLEILGLPPHALNLFFATRYGKLTAFKAELSQLEPHEREALKPFLPLVRELLPQDRRIEWFAFIAIYLPILGKKYGNIRNAYGGNAYGEPRPRNSLDSVNTRQNGLRENFNLSTIGRGSKTATTEP